MKSQAGGTFLGFVIGVMVGLAVAMVVAIFVTKVPIPFISKDAARAPLSEAAEAKRNQDWNPNLTLIGKSPNRSASAPVGTVPASGSSPAPAAPTPPAKAATGAASAPDAEVAAAKPSLSAPDPFLYFVQVGAFRTPEDADAQKARLTLQGIETKVSEREQSGRIVYRVRVGPFDFKDDAEKVKERIIGSGVEAVLVRVQR